MTRPMFEDTGLKLGLFSANCSGGFAVTKIDERWDASWDNNEKMAIMADDAGLDFLLPIARWIGYGGDTNFHGGVLETITWQAGLLAKTKNITVFATVHVTCQRDGTTVLPRAWDHLEVLLSIVSSGGGVNADAPALAV